MKITKLFAVAALSIGSVGVAGADAPRTVSSGRPACGNVMSKSPEPRDCVDREAVTVAIEPAVQSVLGVATKLRAAVQQLVATAVIDTPRVLANGRPAAGNVMTKTAPKREVLY